jgi:hypothetical protein
MGNRLAPRIILEGTRLSCKPEIAFEMTVLAPGPFGAHGLPHRPLAVPWLGHPAQSAAIDYKIDGASARGGR